MPSKARHLRMWQYALLGCALCWTSQTSLADLTIHSVSPLPGEVGLYQPLFISFGLSESYTNPFDPRIVNATFEFTGPSDLTRVIPAFRKADFPGWEARIVPIEVGPHQCRIVVNDGAGQSASHDLAFTAVPSDERGFVRIDSRNPRYLRFDNGDPYLPVGHNLCWYGNDSRFTSWLINMAAVGENWARYWMVPYVGQGIEWGGGIEPSAIGLGRYSQNHSEMFDRMLEDARIRNIQVQLCLDSFNGWNVAIYDNWHENPYNAANGGMLDHPIEYFTHTEAQRLARQRIRYIVSRWAYNTTILCWEFWNEADIIGIGDSGGNYFEHVAEATEWHRIMGQYIRSIDPFEHLRSTSFADDNASSYYTPIWELDEMDIVQVHQYHNSLPYKHVEIIQSRRPFGKPVILGEGNLAGVPESAFKGSMPLFMAQQADPTGYEDGSGQSLHDMIWAAAVVESGAMSWWWDGWIHPNNLYTLFRPLARFLENEDWAPMQMAPANLSIMPPHTFEIYGSAGPMDAYLWGRNPYPSANGLEIRLAALDPGGYEIEYWNTDTGTIMTTHTRSTESGDLYLNPPYFEKDIAIKIHIAGPFLAVDPSALYPTATSGTNAPPNVLSLRTYGVDMLNYNASENVGWIDVIPSTGTVGQEPNLIAVVYQTAFLPPGTYNTHIEIDADEAFNTPVLVDVTVTIEPHPADFDGDDDVDQSDFGHIQECLTGAGFAQYDVHCLDTDLDGDEDVDESDISVFRECKSGSGIRPDPLCLPF